jgi:hypothetical protein
VLFLIFEYAKWSYEAVENRPKRRGAKDRGF